MTGFYNYDTRGASWASQIVNLERMLEERDTEIERLRNLLRSWEEALIEARFERDTLAARLAEAEALLRMARDVLAEHGSYRERFVDPIDSYFAPDSASRCNHFPGQSTCEWCGATADQPEDAGKADIDAFLKETAP